MTEATATIPQERLKAYADTVTTMGDMEGLMTSINRLCTDMAILEHEGRATATKGAYLLLAGVVRRMCATAAWSKESAKTKVGVLDSAKQLYRGGKDGRLMTAMIDAAIGLETENWPASSTQH